MIKRIAIVLIGILVVLVGKGLFYYSGFYSPPPSEMPSYEQIVVPATPSTEFSDVYEKWEGTILIDRAHDNDFDIEELNVLTLRLISRGLTIDFYTEHDLEEQLLGGKEEGKRVLLEDAFVVVCPQSEFSKEERDTIDEFVSNGGKLLLIADPTRQSEINILSLQFGLIFEPGYLYNMKENDTNYRNIFVTKFKENEITKDLEKIALYTAGSITSTDCGIAFGDENTFSSVIETRKGLSPIALAQESKVLAIYDLTFIKEPYNGILSNNQLISNIADWLASPTKPF